MRFSERMGLRPVKSVIQIDSMDDELRNALWDVHQLIIWDREESSYLGTTATSNCLWLFRAYWHSHFKQPIDTLPSSTRDTIQAIRRRFFSGDWSEVYDFVEFTAKALRDDRAAFVKKANQVLERELSGYRFIGSELAQVSAPEELESIEAALAATTGLKGANAHLKASLALLADRKKPDFRNSIKEAVSAVESISQALTGDSKATLGAALKVLEQKAGIHPALKASLSSLYGYTSDSDGIRHAMLEESTLTFADAKFMLVACTAFVNYLVAKSATLNVKLAQ